MTRRLWMLGVCVFALTLLLNVPAALIVRAVDWPAGWQPQAVSGTLWNGRLERVGPIGPLVWQLQPWRGQAQASGGFEQQAWDLTVHGWPRAWQAQLTPGAPLVTPPSGYALDGRWRGGVSLHGRGARCTSSQGELRADDMALLAPWMMVLGDARLNIDCRDGIAVLADVRRAGEHRFSARLEPFARRARLNGQVEPQASVTPLLVQSGMLKTGESSFERTFGSR